MLLDCIILLFYPLFKENIDKLIAL